MFTINYSESCDFDFMRWTSNLLLEFNPIISSDPEYILVSPWRNHNWYTDKKLIYITNENYDLFPPYFPLNRYHAVIGLYPPEEPCNFIQFPYVCAHHDVPIEHLYLSREKFLSIPKTEFCCFISQNSSYGDQSTSRIDFFKKLNQYKKIMSGGGVYNNVGCRIPRGLHALRWISQFKFMICFENSVKKGYISEKPFDPWFVGTIPIYVGDTSILNSKAYLDGRDIDIIDKIIKLDNDDDLFREMQCEEIIHNKISLDTFNLNFKRQVLTQ